MIVKEHISKKYIKKILRLGEKAHCKSCGAHLRKVEHYDKENGNITKFVCSSASCLFEVSISDKDNKLGYINKEVEDSILIINYPILGNKYYNIIIDGKEIEYNPHNKTIKVGNSITLSNSKQHNIYCKEVERLCQ